MSADLPVLPEQAAALESFSAADTGVHCAGGCIDRREFVTASLLAAATALLAACGHPSQLPSGEAGPQTAQSSAGSVVRLADYPDLANAGGVATIRDRKLGAIAIVRGENDRFVALSLRCPHRRGTISLEGDQWVCSRHGGRFEKDGTKIAGPSPTNMKALSATYDAAAGTITINAG
jgi:nitrite reductase/ring-hydroxylating ferredoxin subunit